MPCCPYCGWPDDDPVTTVSMNRNRSGSTVWTRCVCGSLQTRVRRGNEVAVGALEVCARSRPAGSPAASL